MNRLQEMAVRGALAAVNDTIADMEQSKATVRASRAVRLLEKQKMVRDMLLAALEEEKETTQ